MIALIQEDQCLTFVFVGPKPGKASSKANQAAKATLKGVDTPPNLNISLSAR